MPRTQISESAERPASIDVLIPIYNMESTALHSIASIQEQSTRDIRIVIVDDGSTDNTPSILSEIARADSRVTVINQKNGGIVNALNNGLSLCTAEFVARHDADDVAFPDRLYTQLSYLKSNKHCLAVSGNAFHIDGAGKRTGTRSEYAGEARYDPDRIPAWEPYLMHPFLMFRRKPVAELGGYRFVFHSEDTDLYWRLVEHGCLQGLPNLLGEYRYHAEGVSSRSIVNGRIQAVSSQLAALSYKRRRRRVPDLEFPAERLREYEDAKSMAAIVALAEQDLELDERSYLELNAAMKLLDQSTYRPYDLERSDIEFIRGAVRRHFPSEDWFTPRDVRRKLVRGALSLLRRGKYVRFAQLLPEFCSRGGAYQLFLALIGRKT